MAESHLNLEEALVYFSFDLLNLIKLMVSLGFTNRFRFSIYKPKCSLFNGLPQAFSVELHP